MNITSTVRLGEEQIHGFLTSFNKVLESISEELSVGSGQECREKVNGYVDNCIKSNIWTILSIQEWSMEVNFSGVDGSKDTIFMKPVKGLHPDLKPSFEYGIKFKLDNADVQFSYSQLIIRGEAIPLLSSIPSSVRVSKFKSRHSAISGRCM